MAKEHHVDHEAVRVRVQGVEKTFKTKDEESTVLDAVDLQLDEGSFVSLVGRSGCGKTTLLRMVGGLEPPTAGSIELSGMPVYGPNGVNKEATRSIGFVFQSATLLPWRSALSNVMLPFELLKNSRLSAKDAEALALSALELVGLGDAIHKHPIELSGGMQQRVSLARALAFDPDLLLMDEPFGALDALTRSQMIFELHRIWRQTGKTILFVTHDINEAVLLSQRVVVLSPEERGIATEVVLDDLPMDRTSDVIDSEAFAGYTSVLRRAIGVVS